jgi:nucleoside-diphosphate kinase
VIERTLVLVKPDGVQRQLIGRIISRYEDRGLRLVGLKIMQVDRGLVERQYEAHRERPFFAALVQFMTCGPVVAMVLEGPSAISVVRALNGATQAAEAAPGTVRGDFALDTRMNLVHSSDGPEAAEREIELWFRPEELLSYGRDVDRWIGGECGA